MKILIIGASRGIGLQLVQQALEGGHTVTAMVRRPGSSIEDEHLKVRQGDILDGKSVSEATAGQEAVCVAVGIKPTRQPTRVFSDGIRNVIRAMEQHGVRQLISVSGIGAGDSRGHGGFLYDRLLFPLLLQRIYEDKERQEQIIRDCSRDWIIVRPGFLTNGEFTGQYRVLTDLAGVKAGRISRADSAHFILEQLRSPTCLRQTPLITY